MKQGTRVARVGRKLTPHTEPIPSWPHRPQRPRTVSQQQQQTRRSSRGANTLSAATAHTHQPASSLPALLTSPSSPLLLGRCVWSNHWCGLHTRVRDGVEGGHVHATGLRPGDVPVEMWSYKTYILNLLLLLGLLGLLGLLHLGLEVYLVCRDGAQVCRQVSCRHHLLQLGFVDGDGAA
jgi:hypothetical protein